MNKGIDELSKKVTDEKKKEVVLNNNWYTLWNDNNWVRSEMQNKDYCGVSLDRAYAWCLINGRK